MSVTQIVYKALLQMPAFEPPEPKGKKTKYGQDDKCWLCSGATEGLGWHVKDVIGSAFTDTNLAKCVSSQTICYSCAALMKKETWEPACIKHGHSPYFPIKDSKKPFLANWMFSSHVFSKDGWLRPARHDIADVLINPPNPPFVITLADVGKKHVIFKSQVSYSSDNYFVNIDEQTIKVDRQNFIELLKLIEEAYQYFSKDSLLTGEYNQKSIMDVGIKTWRGFEDRIKKHRQNDNDVLKLACFVARKLDD